MHDDPLPSGLAEGPGELAALPATPGAPYTASAVFTGQGGEYFRLWVVNILLTLVTLGLYSAWAKVRTARYFRNNTWLDGHVFDYHGSPAAILRGRIIALILLAAYSWAFQFSNVAGLLTIAILCAVGPWLFMRAQQFERLSAPESRFGVEKIPDFLSTHPATEERLERLRREIR